MQSITKEIEGLVTVGDDVDHKNPQAMASALANAVNDLQEDKWKTLSDPAQAWANATLEELSLAGEAALTGKDFKANVLMPDEWLEAGNYKPPRTSGNGHKAQETTARPVIRERTAVTPIESIPIKKGEPKKDRSAAMKLYWEKRRKAEAAVTKGKTKESKVKSAATRRKVTHRTTDSNASFALVKGIAELQFLVKIAKQPDCPPSIKASIKTMVEAELTKFIGDL